MSQQLREMNSKCKVLVVDDIHENIELVADMLKGLDVEIQKVDGGAKAIELVPTAYHKKYALPGL